MHTNKFYTGIGSRETPEDILTLMAQIAAYLAKDGWTLRSGHAPGADQAFELGAKHMNGAMEIYLPWKGFEGAPLKLVDPRYMSRFPADVEEEATRVAEMFHPAWDKCSQGAKKLHTRNVYQIAGQDLLTASNFIVCWTKDGKRGGGTGQALRMAEYLEIPIFDLAICSPEELFNYITQGKKAA